jgi:2-methylisocitrate lyase-like PEP mutase family enzyme
MTNLRDKAAHLLHMYNDIELLQVVNVWDVASARTIAALPETRAIATASHAIAESYGYEDGENIPLELALATIERIVAATDLPVTADLESGYGDAGETVRRAIGIGVVGANIEDGMRPLADAVAAVSAVVSAGEAEGIPFVLNARTDAFVFGRDRPVDDVTADAIERGRAFLDAGAACVFVPGRFDENTVVRLVDGIGVRRVSVMGMPGSLPPARLHELGIARISYGPMPQRVALTALQDAASVLYAGGSIPANTRTLP